MSREDANLIVAVASLVVACFATWAAVYSIRRDRAELRVTSTDAAAGNRYLIVVNVGLRPVRIEQLVVRTWRVAKWWSKLLPIHVLVADRLEAGMRERELPVVIPPAGEFVMHYGAAEIGQLTGMASYELLLEDAAGRHFSVKPAVRVRRGLPPGDLFPPGG